MTMNVLVFLASMVKIVTLKLMNAYQIPAKMETALTWSMATAVNASSTTRYLVYLSLIKAIIHTTNILTNTHAKHSYAHTNIIPSLHAQGVNCETDLNSCRNSPCHNGGTCENEADGFYSCTCPPGHTGFNCEFMDHCLSSPCNNQATCMVNN